MKDEWLRFDRKSLKTVVGKTADFNEIAKDCVAFANARGGELHIGIEDGEELPPMGQTIPESLPTDVILRINQLTINVYLQGHKEIAQNGAEFFILTIIQSSSAIASTTKGQYFIRIGDESRPVLPDELMRLVTDKSAFCWETRTDGNVKLKDCDRSKLSLFLSDIRSSDRVSAFVKSMPDQEILLHYLLIDDKGTKYCINPKLISSAKSNIRTTLKTIEPYRLKELIKEDLRFHPLSSLENIGQRLPDVNYQDLTNMVRKMADASELVKEGGRKYRKYRLP